MVVVAQVHQLVNDHVVECLGPAEDQAPVEGDGAGGRAGAPAGALVSDPDLAGFETEPLALDLDQGFDPLPCLAAVPAVDCGEDLGPATPATTSRPSRRRASGLPVPVGSIRTASPSSQTTPERVKSIGPPAASEPAPG